MLRRWAVPSLSDCLFFSLLGWLFFGGSSWSALLSDGDTGWHIRTGEYILNQHQFPTRDLFSFSRPDASWYAWEWLSDTAFALVYRPLGLKGVVLLSGAAIALSALLVFRRMLWRGSNLFLALAALYLAVGASLGHYLARPHVFTLLLLAAALWLLDADRRRKTRAVWLLIPLAALWTNLHGGFVALPASLAVLAAGSAIEALLAARADRAERIGRAVRYGMLAAGCAAASLANPYGYRLLGHIYGYLRSNWILEAVHEFQSPSFRSESALYFEVLLFAGLMLAAYLAYRKRIAEALLIVFWAHASLVSVRHVPLFAIVAAPLIASELSVAWRRWAAGCPARSTPAALEKLAADFAPAFRRNSAWAAGAIAALVFVDAPIRWPRDFPEAKFPVAMVARHAARLAGARVFTSDQWADYLIYRFYPRHRVFLDGRSDFYGQALGKAYLRISYAHPEWQDALARYGCTTVLAPAEWPLAGVMKQSSAWRVVDSDPRAVLFERR